MKTAVSLNVLGGNALLVSLLEDSPVTQRAHSLEKDVEVVTRRLASEGVYFATSVLPLLGKAVDRALETGVLEPVRGFGTAHDSALPAFMQDVLRHIFHDDGTLVPVDDANRHTIGLALRHVRTVSFFAYKCDLPFDDSVLSKYEEHFIATDSSLPDDGDLVEVEELLATAAYEVARLVGEAPSVEELIPRHGPGAVADGEQDEEKFEFDKLPIKTARSRLESLFFVSTSHREDRRMFVTARPPCSRVAFVPKDSRGPRVIAIEPKELQWLQQALRGALVSKIEVGTEFRVNFEDQRVNRVLALKSSRTRLMATLDMKDASDRVARALVRRVFPADWFELLDSSRSEAALLPSGRRVELRKMSSMGSATTFPVEAIVFWAVAVAAIARVVPGQRGWIRRHVYAYGDDLIVPRQHAAVVMDALESVGLLVNRTKSFIDGYFRESCGMDAYHGEIVTPTRMKKPLPTKRTDVGGIVASTDLANRLDAVGYHRAAEYLYKRVERLLGDRLPFGSDGCGYLHRWTPLSPTGAFHLSRENLRYRWDSSLQRIEAKVWAVEKRSRPTLLDGWSRMLRNLTMGSGDSPGLIVPTRARLKLRKVWRPVTR